MGTVRVPLSFLEGFLDQTLEGFFRSNSFTGSKRAFPNEPYKGRTIQFLPRQQKKRSVKGFFEGSHKGWAL